jgi:hypothetical protein
LVKELEGKCLLGRLRRRLEKREFILNRVFSYGLYWVGSECAPVAIPSEHAVNRWVSERAGSSSPTVRQLLDE